MDVITLISVLRNCNVNFLLSSNESHIATCSIFFYGSGTSVNFCDVHFDPKELYSLTVTDIYVKGPGLLNIYVS